MCEIHSSITTAAERALAKLAESPLRPRYVWPWAELEEDVTVATAESARAGRDGALPRLFLIGYGSLLNPDSARRTIVTTPPAGHPAVLAFGGRRVFNYVISVAAAIERYGMAPAGRRGAALNAERTGAARDVINGRLLDVPLDDLGALREREYGYDLEAVVFVPWSDGLLEGSVQGVSGSVGNSLQFEIGYILCAPAVPASGIRRTRRVVDDALLPHPGYLATCRAGADLVSPGFGRLFLTSTVLGDRTTRLSEFVASDGNADA